jgi:hypothetical protein
VITTIQKLGSYALFQRSANLETPRQIISWWEKRRITFNLIIGGVGLFVCLLQIGIASYSEHILGETIGFPDPPVFIFPAIIFYGIAANICYTAGWIVELFVKTIWKGRFKHFGKYAFALGLGFSVVLTILPFPVSLIVVAVKSFTSQK